MIQWPNLLVYGFFVINGFTQCAKETEQALILLKEASLPRRLPQV